EDAVTLAVVSGDPRKLAALTQLTETECSSQVGVGTSPNCHEAPGSPTDGAVVEVFPFTTCEGEWTHNVEEFWHREFLSYSPELYAVLALDEPAFVQGITGYPEFRQVIVFEA